MKGIEEDLRYHIRPCDGVSEKLSDDSYIEFLEEVIDLCMVITRTCDKLIDNYEDKT
jgi:hypothetical protein